MNPSNQESDNNNTPEAQSVSTISVGDKKAAELEADKIFVIQPPEKKPLDKKSIAIVSGLTFLGVIILIGVLIFALVSSAGGLARDYRSRALIQLKKLDAPLKDYEPSSVLNERNLIDPKEKISISKAAQPSLDNVLFIAPLNKYYLQTASIESDIKNHYDELDKYTEDVQKLLVFDELIQEIGVEEAQLIQKLNNSDSLAVRSISGNYKDFADRVSKAKAPSQLSELQSKIVKIYTQKAAIYLEWAKSLEGGDQNGINKSQQELQVPILQIEPLVTDQAYVHKMLPSYNKILTQQKKLESDLAN